MIKRLNILKNEYSPIYTIVYLLARDVNRSFIPYDIKQLTVLNPIDVDYALAGLLRLGYIEQTHVPMLFRVAK